MADVAVADALDVPAKTEGSAPTIVCSAHLRPAAMKAATRLLTAAVAKGVPAVAIARCA